MRTITLTRDHDMSWISLEGEAVLCTEELATYYNIPKTAHTIYVTFHSRKPLHGSHFVRPDSKHDKWEWDTHLFLLVDNKWKVTAHRAAYMLLPSRGCYVSIEWE